MPRGLDVGNVDATVIVERPKLAPYIDQMRANLAAVLGVSINRVSIKGKTTRASVSSVGARPSRLARSH